MICKALFFMYRTPTQSLFFAFVLFHGWGCASPYTEVRRQDTIAAYKDFLQKYPQSPDRKDAEGRLEVLAFQKASEENSEESYASFLRDFPQSRFARQANTQLEIKRYKRARDRDTLESYQDFLRRFPNGQFAREAKDRAEEHFFQKALRYQSVRGMEAYLQHFPSGRFARQAEEHHRTFWWRRVQRTPSLSHLEAFLRRFPEGIYVAEAKAKILQLRYDRYEMSGKPWLLQRWLKDNPDSPLSERARKHITLFQRLYPTLERARRHAEAGETQRAVTIYRQLQQRYAKDFPIVAKLVERDLARHKIAANEIR